MMEADGRTKWTSGRSFYLKPSILTTLAILEARKRCKNEKRENSKKQEQGCKVLHLKGSS
jgi:hypothetical protein